MLTCQKPCCTVIEQTGNPSSLVIASIGHGVARSVTALDLEFCLTKTTALHQPFLALLDKLLISNKHKGWSLYHRLRRVLRAPRSVCVKEPSEVAAKNMFRKIWPGKCSLFAGNNSETRKCYEHWLGGYSETRSTKTILNTCSYRVIGTEISQQESNVLTVAILQIKPNCSVYNRPVSGKKPQPVRFQLGVNYVKEVMVAGIATAALTFGTNSHAVAAQASCDCLSTARVPLSNFRQSLTRRVFAANVWFNRCAEGSMIWHNVVSLHVTNALLQGESSCRVTFRA